MFKDFIAKLEKESEKFKTMSKAELLETEQDLERLESILTNVAFPRLFETLEKDNPAYTKLPENLKKVS